MTRTFETLITFVPFFSVSFVRGFISPIYQPDLSVLDRVIGVSVEFMLERRQYRISLVCHLDFYEQVEGSFA